MRNRTKVSPKLTWLSPYLQASIPLLPSNIKITRLSAWNYNNKRVGRSILGCIYTNDGINYRIYLHTKANLNDTEVRPRSKIDLLTTLAHELAHTLDMQHSPQHKALESKLTILFMNMLKREGYVSEEVNEKETVLI